MTEEPGGEGGSSGPRQVEKMFHPGNKKIRPLVPTKHRAWCVPFLKTEIAFTKSLRSMNRAHVRKHFRLKQRRLECAGPGEGRTCVWRHASNFRSQRNFPEHIYSEIEECLHKNILRLYCK